MSHSKMRPAIRHARPILGGCFAALLALSAALPGPATAQQQGLDPQLSQIIGGALIAGGLAKILGDRADERELRRREESSHESGRRGLPAVRVHRDFAPVIEPPRRGLREGRAAAWRILPASCLRDVTGGRYVQRVVGRTCLQRAGVRASLPVSCATTLDRGGRRHVVYRAACLREAGFGFR